MLFIYLDNISFQLLPCRRTTKRPAIGLRPRRARVVSRRAGGRQEGRSRNQHVGGGVTSGHDRRRCRPMPPPPSTATTTTARRLVNFCPRLDRHARRCRRRRPVVPLSVVFCTQKTRSPLCNPSDGFCCACLLRLPCARASAPHRVRRTSWPGTGLQCARFGPETGFPNTFPSGDRRRSGVK